MSTSLEVLERLEALDVEEVFAQVVDRLIDFIAMYNSYQLSKGLNNAGEWLPRYVDDPWFDSIQQALGYQRYKKRVSPNRSKPEDIMDFYINGYTHDHIEARVTGKNLEIWNTTPWADEIDQKTNNKALGLNEESATELYNKEIQPLLVEYIKERTGLM